MNERASFKTRRALQNKLLGQRLKGRLVFVSSSPVVLPMRTVDLKVDEQILQGKLRDVKIIVAPDGKQVRVGCTKGVTYLSPSKLADPGMKRRERRAL